jgi:O-antigen ligase
MPSIPRFSEAASLAQPALLGAAVVLAYLQWPFLGLLLIAAFAVTVFALRRRPAPGPTPADLAVVLVLAYEVPSMAASVYPANGWPFLDELLSASLAYFCVRALAPSRNRLAVLAWIVTGLGVVLSAGGLRNFVSGLRLEAAAGFSGIAPFRERLSPGPPAYIAGEWYTILLLTVPFALILVCDSIRNRHWALRVLAVCAFLTISVELMATCSRAVVWALIGGLAIFCAGAAVYRLASFKTGMKYLAVGAALMISSACVEETAFPGLAACYVDSDVSQSRSVQGRIGAWRNGLAGASGHLLWGIGSNNAVMATAAASPMNFDAAFAVQVFSLPLQMVVEKGVVGTACYAFLLCSVGLGAHRRLRGPGDALGKLFCLAAASGVCMGCMRDIVYCSLFSHNVTAILLFLLSGIAASPVPA